MSFPDGYETGTYLALDMGGTNLRVCEIALTDNKSEFDIIQSKYRMPEELKTGDSEELWDYIADCLAQFIETHHGELPKGETLPLGFTFSYPATQNYIDEGILQRWTKGFDIDGVEGKNVVPLLQDALNKQVSISQGIAYWSIIDADKSAECSHRPQRSHQRYHRNTHCICIHRHRHEDWMYLRYWM